jgi:signal transduction histidine kinase
MYGLSGRKRSVLLILLASSVLGLLGSLAALQYRWAWRLSEGELQQLRASARGRGIQYSREFDREITRAFLWLAVDAASLEEPTRFAESYARWAQRAPRPKLVKDLFVLSIPEEGPSRHLRFDPKQRRFVDAEWPPSLKGLEGEGREPLPPRGNSSALVIPILRHERGSRTGPRAFAGYEVLLLDMNYIQNEFLPALERQYFAGTDGFDYALTVVAAHDPATVIYASQDASRAGRSADPIAVHLFEPRFDDDNRDLLDGMNPGLEPFGRRLFGIDENGHRPAAPGRSPRFGEGERWRLLLEHRGGSLQDVVAASRRQNLMVSLGILVVLGLSVVVLAVLATRAERLAEQQMEFVAGISHELRTPITAICSAGENLADGLVSAPPQVQRYGALIRNEGRRLADTVEQVLEFVGTYSGKRRYDSRPIDARSLVEAVLASAAFAIAESGFTVRKEIEEPLPSVISDPNALRRVVQNLVQNALKYGAESRWLGVRVGVASGGSELQIAVEDRGLGIDAADLARIFEPFYRGKEAVARQVPGSGLGLCVAKRTLEGLGGRLSVESQLGVGSTFTVHLPVRTEVGSVPETRGVHGEANPSH